MVSRYSAYRRGSDTIPPEVIDRILVGVCAAVWLVLIGVSVAAAVALADLGRGFHKMASNPHTTWVLYGVIVVSALIIAGAVPVLLRARRMARVEPPARPAGVQARGGVRQPVSAGRSTARIELMRTRTERVQAVAQPGEWFDAAVDRIWLRGTVGLAGTMGAALIAAAAATYLMAVGRDGASWVGYLLAGIITAVMPVIEWLYVRQLRRVFNED
ncbi:DUF2561 family protein [Mycobacterium haemophilum]|uniref:Membrane protein n=1 Tax=Mycobacterium haemophilum TaxID=29311 RepID=A0A0I9XXW9_9MYCO|nr:DUF2561 family protein [Mycobacterium haemophilum]KLO32042.1 membrane protein [Mycobacterium haemophilum]KLO36393.1 membrane protein [Mycobacterium haemophilum]KLO42278.1 membrane protein [Mycobacterium haemophilum]KLO50079.1 membrane protein [Mycobacterium haemophilum]